MRVERLAMIAMATMAALSAAGCMSLGGSNPPRTYYVLEDAGSGRGAEVARPAAAIPRTLLIAATRANPLADSPALVYARAPGQRAQYQFASWADRPSQRIVRLLEERLNRRATFTATALLGSGVTGDLLLAVELEQLFHDVTTKPGMGHVTLAVEMIDRPTGTSLGRRRFTMSSRAAAENAQGAVDALSASLGLLLDELVPWIETVVRGGSSDVRAVLGGK
jgi:ABC-type uncharacterized transport system auxiliary subunit